MVDTSKARSSTSSQSPPAIIPANMMDGELIATITKLQLARETVLRTKKRGDEDAYSGMAKLDLPRIVAAGMQSAGKSSVLESIVGFDFLPRGQNTVTRRPIIIDLKTLPDSHVDINATLTDEVGLKESRTFDREQISRKELTETIQKATDFHPDIREGKLVAPDPIYIEIRSPHVLTLTLVDLPGVVVHPDKMREATEAMVMKQIMQENTIVLVVHPASQDIQNDRAIELAEQVDPEGRRTIGVLTKLDEKDTTGRKEVYNTFFPKDGIKKAPPAIKWIPVKNRSPNDMAADTTIPQQRENEMKFFETLFVEPEGNRFSAPDAFPDINATGVDFLANTLKTELLDRSRKSLRHIKNEVSKVKDELSEDLDTLERRSDKNEWENQGEDFISEFTRKFEDELSGQDMNSDLKSVGGGAKLVRLYKGEFVESMESVDPLERIKDDKVLKDIIESTRAHHDTMFLPYGALLRVLKDSIETDVIEICRNCVEDVYVELVDQAKHTAKLGDNGGLLSSWAFVEAEDVIMKWKQQCLDFVESLVLMERRVNTSHPECPDPPELRKILDGASGSTMKKSFGDFTSQQLDIYFNVTSDGADVKTGAFLCSLVRRDENKVYLQCLGENFFWIDLDHIEILEGDNRGAAFKTPERTPLFRVKDKRGNQVAIACPRKDEVTSYRTLLVGAKMIRNEKPAVALEENKECAIIRYFHKRYFDKVVRIKIIDSVPKAIAYLIIDKVMDRTLAKELRRRFRRLRNEGGLAELMAWTEDDEREKEDLAKAILVVEDALNSLSNVDKKSARGQ